MWHRQRAAEERHSAAEDRRRTVALLLEQARTSLNDANDRVATIEQKASWLLGGALPTIGLLGFASAKVANDLSGWPSAVEWLTLVPLVLCTSLLVAAVLCLLRVIGLSKFKLMARDWLREQVTLAEVRASRPYEDIALGMAEFAIRAADAVAERANTKRDQLRNALRLVIASALVATVFVVALAAKIVEKGN